MESSIFTNPARPAEARVLIINDDAGVRRLVRMALRRVSCNCFEAADGADGIARAREIRPDLILCDFSMPGMNGYQVLTALQADPITSATQIILMTGNAESADLRKSMESGADDYLAKPFTREKLVAAVEPQLSKRRRLQQHEVEIQRRLFAIMEATPDFIGVADLKTGRVIYMNRAARIMMGVAPDADVTCYFIHQFHPGSVHEHIQNEIIPVALRDGLWRGETIFRRLDGTEVFMAQLILAHISAAGEVDCLSTIARDITQQKRDQQERDMMEVHLRHAQKLESIGHLAAGIAHEINTPTQYVGDNISFLQESFAELARLDVLYDRLLDPALVSPDREKLVAQIHEARAAANHGYLLNEIPRALTQAAEGVTRVSHIVRAMKEFSHPGKDSKTYVDLNHAIELQKSSWLSCQGRQVVVGMGHATANRSPGCSPAG